MRERGTVLWWLPPMTVLLCLLLGVVVGAGMNVVNARVSRYYFLAIVEWEADEVPRAAVAEGALEGCILGLLYGVVLSITAAASARLRCPASLIATTALRTVPIALACWLVGGVAGITFAAVEPRAFQSRFVPGAVALTTDQLLRFAWVGGSIWGAYASTVIGAVYASVTLHRRWHARLKAERSGFPVSPLVRPVAISALAPVSADRSGDT